MEISRARLRTDKRPRRIDRSVFRDISSSDADNSNANREIFIGRNQKTVLNTNLILYKELSLGIHLVWPTSILGILVGAD